MASQESIVELFDLFVSASTLRALLTAHKKILNKLDLKPCKFSAFFPAYKKGVCPTTKHGDYWKASSILSKIERKASCPVYNVPGRGKGKEEKNNALKGKNVLVIGGGPCGLRTAIEMQFLGAEHVVIVEKRDRFSRNNVLHLWKFVIEDLKSLGAKKFYGKFCAGNIDHASIRQLQLILLKVALITGCEFHENISFEEVCPRYLVPTTTKQSQQQASDNMQAIPGNCGSRCPATIQGLDPSEAVNECSCCCHEHELGLSEWCNGSSHSSASMPSGAVAHFTFTTTPSVLSTSYKNSTAIPSTSQSNLSSNQLHAKGSSNQLSQDLNHLKARLNSYRFEILIGADGRRNTLSDNFPRKEFRGHKLAIAITANFINEHSLREAQIPEIAGISFIYNQPLFKRLESDTGIDLENICYYKDDTHYFVMTAKKSSLLARNVLKRDCNDTRALLAPENINRQELLKYARDAASWTTGTGYTESNQSSDGSMSTSSSNSCDPHKYEFRFALNHYGEADVAMFDFTSMYAAENACKVKRLTRTCNRCAGKSEASTPFTDDKENAKNSDDRKFLEPLLLMGLVGDSLLEPFWPMGTGLARGFLSAFDAAWMARQWMLRRAIHERTLQSGSTNENRGSTDGQDDNFQMPNPPASKGKLSARAAGRGSPTKVAYRSSEVSIEDELLQVLAERESIYRLLAQTKSENLNQNYSSYTLNPATRYPNLNPHTLLPYQVRHLLGDEHPPPNPHASFTDRNAAALREKNNAQAKRARRATVAVAQSINNELRRGKSSATLEEEENSPKKQGQDTKSYRNSEAFTGRNLSPLLARRYLSRKDSFEDSLQQFETEYQRSKEFTQLQKSATSSRIPNRVTRNNSFKESIERSNSNNAVIYSPSASNMASLERSRLKDIQMCLKQRRQHLDKLSSSGSVESEAREILARTRHTNSLYSDDRLQTSREPVDDEVALPSRNFSLAKSFTTNLSDSQKDSEFTKRRALICQSLYGGSSSNSSENHSHSSGSRSPREFTPKDEAYMLRKLQVKAARSLQGSIYDRDFLKRSEDLMSTSYPSNETNYRKPRPAFADRVKDLEVKLYQASGLLNEHRLASQSRNDQGRQLKSSEIYGPQVATLQELLAQQFKQNETTPKNKPVKVGKITTEDWNVKVWEQKMKSPPGPPSPSKSLSPRPEKALEVFRDRLSMMENKLTDDEKAIFDEGSELLEKLFSKKSKDTNTVLASVKDSRRSDFVSLLKNELSARNVSPKTLPRKGPIRSATARNFGGYEDDEDVTEGSNSKPRESHDKSNKSKGLEHSSSTADIWPKSSLCVRCGIVVPTMDRILLSGVVLHRTCLTCSRCGVTLRLSEVRTQQSSNSSSTNGPSKDGNLNPSENDSKSGMNYFCVLCSNLNSKTTVEERIRDKQKWKEQFLSNSSAVDLRQYIKDPKEKEKEEREKKLAEAAAAAAAAAMQQKMNIQRRQSLGDETVTDSLSVAPDVTKHDNSSETSSMISERIEYENMSCSDELYDDDELTKLLNLDSDLDTDEVDDSDDSDSSDDHDADDDDDDKTQEGDRRNDEDEQEDESDTTSSSDWSPDSDSTENDFDSDELDQSFSIRSDARAQGSKPLLPPNSKAAGENNPSLSTTTDSQGSASESTGASRKENKASRKKNPARHHHHHARKQQPSQQQRATSTRRQESVPEIVIVSEPDIVHSKSDESQHEDDVDDDDSPKNMDQSDASELLKSSTLTSLGICGASDSKAYLAESESLDDDDFDEEDKTLEERAPSLSRDSHHSPLLAK